MLKHYHHVLTPPVCHLFYIVELSDDSHGFKCFHCFLSCASLCWTITICFHWEPGWNIIWHCLTLFSFIFHMASYYNRIVPVAEHVACLIVLTWFLCFYHALEGCIVQLVLMYELWNIIWNKTVLFWKLIRFFMFSLTSCSVLHDVASTKKRWGDQSPWSQMHQNTAHMCLVEALFPVHPSLVLPLCHL